MDKSQEVAEKYFPNSKKNEDEDKERNYLSYPKL